MSVPSLFIVGCGRSGTSMTAGLFRNSGRYMGANLHKANSENLKGYFESAPINQLNNQILNRLTPSPEIINGVKYRCDAPSSSGGWLSRIPLNTEISLTKKEQEKINYWVGKTPFCYKDTRFCYLIEHWYYQCDSAKIICVYREPSKVVESILRNCRVHPHLHDFAISVNQAFEVWMLMYQHILEKYKRIGSWLFVNQEDIVNGQAFERLEDFSLTAVDRNFPDRKFDRSVSELPCPKKALKIFNKLKDLSV